MSYIKYNNGPDWVGDHRDDLWKREYERSLRYPTKTPFSLSADDYFESKDSVIIHLSADNTHSIFNKVSRFSVHDFTRVFCTYFDNYSVKSGLTYQLSRDNALHVLSLEKNDKSHFTNISYQIFVTSPDVYKIIFYSITSVHGTKSSLNKFLEHNKPTKTLSDFIQFIEHNISIKKVDTVDKKVQSSVNDTNTTKEKVENNMAITGQTTPAPSMIESTIANAKGALSQGMALAVSNQASEVVLGLVVDVLGADHPVLQTAEGKMLAKIVGSLLAETAATSLLDATTAKQVSSICQNAAVFNVASLLNGKLDVIRPRLLQLVNVASMGSAGK